MKGLSEYYKEPSIYQEALWGLIFGIVALIALAVGFVLTFTIGIFSLGLGALLIGFASLVVVFIFYVMMAMHLRRAFSTLAQKTGETLLRNRGVPSLDRRMANNNLHRHIAYFHSLDICNNRLLRHQDSKSTTSTIHI